MKHFGITYRVIARIKLVVNGVLCGEAANLTSMPRDVAKFEAECREDMAKTRQNPDWLTKADFSIVPIEGPFAG